MGWAECLDAMNDSVLASFAQPVSVAVGAKRTLLDGIYEAPLASSSDPARLPFKRPDHQVTFLSAPFRATGAKQGDAVLIGARRFYIANVEDDDGQMTTVILRPQ